MGLKTLIQNAAKKTAHVATIGGEEFEFRKVRLRALMAARPVLHDVALAISNFFDPSAGEYAGRKVVQDGDHQMVETSGVAPEAAKARQSKQDEAVRRAVSALLDEKNMDAVLGLVLDSIREPEVKVEDLRANMEIDDLFEMVRHMLTANASVFGPFAAKVTSATAELAPKPPVA